MNKNIIYILSIIVIVGLFYFGSNFLLDNFQNEEKVVCLSNNTPVCGVDGLTYEDNCSIEAAGVETANEGACQIGLANPASTNCLTLGGVLEEQLRENGNYNICFFEDNRQCEEWALFYGKCPVGGVKVTGYDNREQTFCAVTGGSVNMNKNTCTIEERTCDLGDYYNNGTCLE